MTKNFNHYTYQWVKTVNYRQHPEVYRIGKGEQGVLICEPYRSEILPYWKFKTPEIALESSEKIKALFYQYLKEHDFVGADLARKFLQMGFTRSRRYANYKGGRKYKDEKGSTFEKGTGDPQKIKSAAIFYEAWQEVEKNPDYQELKTAWKQKEKEMKANDLKKGDSVTWNSQQGPVKGKVVKKVTKDTTVPVGQDKKRKVKATDQSPQVVVKSDQTGKQAVHKPESIKKK